MKRSYVASWVLGGLMLLSALLSHALTPSRRMADHQQKFNLETMIPAQFGDWRIDTSIVPLQVDPETQAKLDQLYNQTLSRTYVNRAGQRVMLSLAYGGDQDDNTGLHRPEVCYAAQGFELKRNLGTDLRTAYGSLPIRRLLAVSGARNEPITYWVTVGGQAVQAGWAQKWQQMKLGLSGTIPDGMLVRVSTLDTDSAAAYQVQDGFIDAMLAALEPQARARLTGGFKL
ncbi:exosortase-associated protein EpsI, B-type [Massilia sp. BJB1822]|uniref:exosortase-associated protein EpsI, B-type n=1 Tax=Massilia sp. BJB1822 TaxID=2744470 RepID=UPI0015943C5C|nr:exosortase-associated protein EpsI, B-type [Massilia sp. BJB1822]NVE00005.1 EpsI family protein [Massilia sp. BJB1822]